VLASGGATVVSVLRDEEETERELEVLVLDTPDGIVYKNSLVTAKWEGDVRADNLRLREGLEKGWREWKGECEWSMVVMRDGEIDEARRGLGISWMGRWRDGGSWKSENEWLLAVFGLKEYLFSRVMLPCLLFLFGKMESTGAAPFSSVVVGTG
jgi:hypothetical protein